MCDLSEVWQLFRVVRPLWAVGSSVGLGRKLQRPETGDVRPSVAVEERSSLSLSFSVAPFVPHSSLFLFYTVEWSMQSFKKKECPEFKSVVLFFYIVSDNWDSPLRKGQPGSPSETQAHSRGMRMRWLVCPACHTHWHVPHASTKKNPNQSTNQIKTTCKKPSN